MSQDTGRQTNPQSSHAVSAANREDYSFVFAGGGTGGHLYPGIAVAEALKDRLGGPAEIAWGATPRAVDRRLLQGFGDNYIVQKVTPLKRNPLTWPAFYSAWRQSCKYWQHHFSERRTAAILALGGYAAGPAAYVGRRMGIPVGLLNPDALPGLANRFLMGQVNCVFAQWAMDDSYSQKFSSRIQSIGCPIRNNLWSLPRDQGIRRLGLAANRRTLVVTGASLGARSINEAMVELRQDAEFLRMLDTPVGELAGWQILLLTGMDQAGAVKAAMAAGPPRPGAKDYSADYWHLLDYCDDMAAVWAVADLAIARSGAGTCAELAACGVPSILIPYPFHRDQHQAANARKLQAADAAVLLTDQLNAAKNAAGLKSVLAGLLPDISRLNSMAENARKQGKPGAAYVVADWLIEQARKRPINMASRDVASGGSRTGI